LLLRVEQRKAGVPAVIEDTLAAQIACSQPRGDTRG